MAQKQLRLPETTVYRKINNELVVVQLDTAHFYYFNPETEALLQFFRTPSTVDQLLASAELGSVEAISEIKTFCQSLLEKKILAESEVGTEITDHSHRPLWAEKENLHPRLLREGEKTIDQISFACP